MFQIIQIPEIIKSIDDGLDGYLLKDTDTPRPFYHIGLAPGDRIITINDKAINTSEDFINTLCYIHDCLESNTDTSLEIIFERQGQQVKYTYEIQETKIEIKEITQLRAILQIGFELLDSSVPKDSEAWNAGNREWAKRKKEPETAVSLALEYNDSVNEMAKNILDQFGLAVGDRLCSVNGVMTHRVDTLWEILFDLKNKIESGEVNEIVIIAQRGEFTRLETTITLID